jgi:hypothetical protein
MRSMIPPTDFAALRRRLAADRAALACELAALPDVAHLPPGILALLAYLHSAAAAVEAVTADEPLAGTGRVMLRDTHGEPLVLAIDPAAGPALAVTLAPLRALALAEDLIAGARRRLAEGTAT